jgi:hypothetical protein
MLDAVVHCTPLLLVQVVFTTCKLLRLVIRVIGSVTYSFHEVFHTHIAMFYCTGSADYAEGELKPDGRPSKGTKKRKSEGGTY